jgi:hypothetical protein
MNAHTKSMTPEALSQRADGIARLDGVAEYIGGDDYRTVTAYFEYYGQIWTPDGNFYTDDASAEIIGVTLGEDDPAFAPTVLDRDGAREMFGDDVVAEWEFLQMEKME